MATLKQMKVRVYTGGNLEGQFQRDANHLGREGWTPGTPAYESAKRGCLGMLMLGFFAPQRSRKMTVVFTR